MVKRSIVVVSIALAGATFAFAQNTNSSTTPSTRTRVVEPKPSPTPKKVTRSTDTEASQATQKSKSTPATGAYQNTPRLVLFNYNGTVTRGWDQLKQNREASYPEMKDVKLDVRDLRVTMLGRDAALITCQWTQSLSFRGTPETDSGRMTIVFRKVGKDWKAIHLHTSPDRPDPTRIPASEQTTPPASKPTP